MGQYEFEPVYPRSAEAFRASVGHQADAAPRGALLLTGPDIRAPETWMSRGLVHIKMKIITAT